jgi:hypothetical protein
LNLKAKSLIKTIYLFFKEGFLLVLDCVTYVIYKNKAIFLPKKAYPNALILGNGASLGELLENKLSYLQEYDIYVCNGFAKSSYYEILKPKYYSLLDPLYFDLNDNRVVSKSLDVLEVWEAIFSKTNWPVIIYTRLFSVQEIAKLKERFGNNENLTWVNLAPAKFYSSKRFFFYSKKIGLAGGTTVVHLSLQIAILSGYNEIFLAGVDHNWFENIKYDTENKKAYLVDKHFYDEKRIYYGEGVLEKIDLITEFKSFAQTLADFKELLQFSIYENVNVFRCTRSFLHFIPFKTIYK